MKADVEQYMSVCLESLGLHAMLIFYDKDLNNVSGIFSPEDGTKENFEFS